MSASRIYSFFSRLLVAFGDFKINPSPQAQPALGQTLNGFDSCDSVAKAENAGGGKMYKEIAGLIDCFKFDSIDLESRIPGSYIEVTRDESGNPVRVGKPQGNQAKALVKNLVQDIHGVLINGGVSEAVAVAALEGRNFRALRQAAPLLAALEARNLIPLLAYGERDSRGISRERAVRSVFLEVFSGDRKLHPVLNIEANASTFALAFLKGDVQCLGNIDVMFQKKKKDPVVKEFERAFDNLLASFYEA